MRITKPLLVLPLFVALNLGFAPVVEATPVSSVGAAGAGDPYFRLQGNGGYVVQHYNLDISYQPGNHRLSGTATILAVATQNLSRFDLDLRDNMVVSRVLVNAGVAGFAQPAHLGQELVITPRSPLRKGVPFSVQVRYSGIARAAVDPDGSLDGFIPTDDGAFVAGEPQGAPTWFPANDTPKDKATYSVQIAVPAGLTAVSNGTRVASWTAKGQTHSAWVMNQPISTYLVTATIGRFNVTVGRTPKGIPILTAVDPTQAQDSAPVLAKLPAMVDWFATLYGPYPFTSTGAIVDNAPDVGYALETATRPLFDAAPDSLTLAHELAHQWFGDSVTLSRWRDIWLNEGFAEFSSWLWDEHCGGMSAAQHLQALLAEPSDSEVWDPPPANPGSAEDIFDTSIYERGAGALQVLRETVGDKVFFAIMRGWATSHRGANATVRDFTTYASRVAHRNLDALFTDWLYRLGKPAIS